MNDHAIFAGCCALAREIGPNAAVLCRKGVEPFRGNAVDYTVEVHPNGEGKGGEFSAYASTFPAAINRARRDWQAMQPRRAEPHQPTEKAA